MNRRQEIFFRKKLLIHPKFQLTLIGVNWFVITMVFAALRYQSESIFSDLTPLTSLSKISDDYSHYFLNYQADRFNTTLLIFYITAMIASGAITLIVSYRFAGPLLRLKSYFNSISDGKSPGELNFRSGDFFSDIPPVVNAALKKLQNSGSEQKESSFTPRPIKKVS
jgi:methyl-accepting chemotaxis protein